MHTVDEFISLTAASQLPEWRGLGPKAMQASFDEFQNLRLPLGKKIKEVLAFSSVSHP